MRCERALDLFAEAWGGPDPVPRRVRRHLERCEACARDAGRIADLLASTAREEVPDPGEAYWAEFLPRVRERITLGEGRTAHAAQAPTGRSRWGPLLLPAAAAILLVAAAGLWALRTPSAPGSPEADLADLDVAMDEMILDAGPGARERIADLFPPWEAAEIDAADMEIEDEKALEAIGRMEGILSPAEFEGIPDLEEVIEGLSADQVNEWLGEIGGADQKPAPAPAEGMAG